MVLFPGKAYDEIAVGDSFGSAMTVTETHLVLAAGLAELRGVCKNQKGEIVVEADGKILLMNRAGQPRRG
jgi:acyl dehydratase